MLSDNISRTSRMGVPRCFHNTLVRSFNHLNNDLQLKIYILIRIVQVVRDWMLGISIIVILFHIGRNFN